MQEDDHLRTIVDTEVDDEHSRKPDVEARRLGLSACLQAAATRERRDSDSCLFGFLESRAHMHRSQSQDSRHILQA